MKNVLLIAICVLVASCTSKQQKAEKLVNDYLQAHLNNPKSYKSVSFGNVDTVFKRYTDTKQGDSLMRANKVAKLKVERIKDTIINLITTSEDNYKDALRRELQYEADTSSFSKTLREKELLFKGSINGWDITHTYHVKNAKGSLVLHIEQFRLDSALTKVLSADEVK